MKGNSTVKPMAESGVLVAAVVILTLVSLYVPLVGSFTLIFLPLPNIMLVMRHGVRWGWMVVLVASLVIGICTGAFAAVNILVLCGLLGTALGYGFRHRWTAVRTILLGAGAGVAGFLLSFGFSLAVLGIHPIAMEAELLRQTVEQAVEFKRSAGASAEEVESFRAALGQSVDLVIRMIPMALILVQVLTAYFNFLAAKAVLRRIDRTELPDLPPLREWRMPEGAVYLFLLSLVGQYWGATRDWTLLYDISLNLNLAALFCGFLQGMGLLFYFQYRYRFSRFMRGLILLILLFTGLLQIFAIAGLCDIALDVRKRLGR